jgi:hypothetical protein
MWRWRVDGGGGLYTFDLGRRDIALNSAVLDRE